MVGQRTRSVVHENDERIARDHSEPGAHRLAARLAARDTRMHLAARKLLSEQDRRLLPLGRSDDHDPVDPVALIETAQRL